MNLFLQYFGDQGSRAEDKDRGPSVEQHETQNWVDFCFNKVKHFFLEISF